MIDVPIEDLLKRTNSLYKLVILAARRTIELIGGSKAQIDSPLQKKLSSVALQEIAEGKIGYKVKV